MPETVTALLESKLPGFSQRFSDAVLAASDYLGDLEITVAPSRVRDTLSALKTWEAVPFSVLMDLFAVDYLKCDPPHPERFAVVYNLYSMTAHRRIRVRTYLDDEEAPSVDSVHDLFKAANWFEREAWDLFGVRFRNHPNLTRILCHEDFKGHPFGRTIRLMGTNA